MGEYDDIVERLQTIEEDLRDRAYDQLRSAASASDPDAQDAAKAQEKKLLQARRGIEKAIRALGDVRAHAD